MKMFIAGEWVDRPQKTEVTNPFDGGVIDTVPKATPAGVDPGMRISCQEVFGPTLAVTRVSNIDEAIRLANNTNYGLGAAIFTESLDRAMRFAREVDSGSIHVNWGTGWRADGMPYGGLKESGFGKEGPKYAIEEMTEMKAVVLHGLGSGG